jgi:hypothetical protein
MPGTHIRERTSARAKQAFARWERFRRMLDQLHDLPFRNSPDLIEVQTAAAFDLQGIFSRTEKSINDH